jgi:hypothetical protein
MSPLGVEFLEYERPVAGRPMPTDSRPTDLWHWQTTLVVPDVEAAATMLHGIAPFVSSSVVALHDASVGFGKRLLVRDPDGHALLLASP